MTSSLASRVDAVLKAYDVRGVTPDPMNGRVGAAYAVAFAEHAEPEAVRPVLLGRDVRTTSPAIAEAVADALTATGWDVMDIGVCSTDMLYFASGEYDSPGIMITASHNPARDNGMKFCRAGARPIGRSDGLGTVAARARAMAETAPVTASRVGRLTGREVLAAYAERLSALAPVTGRPLRIVVDAGNAVAGVTAPATLSGLPVELVPLHFEPDGTFPHHDPNPLVPENIADLRRVVRERDADAGLAFDGDADRCFVVDENGAAVSGSAITALIATRVLAQHPGATILHNVICSRAVPETISAHGGEPLRTPVGHSLIKARMAETGARFGGEHSGHFYFADFFLADSGMLAALHVLAALAASDVPLSRLVAPYERYPASGELNSTVRDPTETMERISAEFTVRDDVEVNRLDGVTIEHAEWWFNVRPSNTEPVLRLNVEATTRAMMERVRDDVLARIREP